MKDINFFDCLDRIRERKDNFEFTIIHGFNEFLGEKIIQSFCDHFLESRSDFSFKRFYFDIEGESSWEDIISEANSSSFFIQSRKIIVVMIRDEKKININSHDMKLIQKYLKKPGSGTVLILYFSLNTTKDEYNQIKRSKIIRLLTQLDSPFSYAIDLDRISEKEVTRYIKFYLNENGISITSSAMEKIIELKGEDYASIINQLPKFEIAGYQEKSFDTEDIDKIITGIEPHSIWDLTESIENEDINKYLEILRYLFINGVKPTFILGTLISYYNKIFTAKFLLKHNFPVADIGKVLQQPGFILNKFIRSVNCFSDKKLQQILKIIYKIDLELKTSGEESARLSLQNFIFQVKFLPTG